MTLMTVGELWSAILNLPVWAIGPIYFVGYVIWKVAKEFSSEDPAKNQSPRVRETMR